MKQIYASTRAKENENTSLLVGEGTRPQDETSPKETRVRGITICGLILIICSVLHADIDLKSLPDEEKKLVDTVDPWGLAFGDQLKRYESYFAQSRDAEFVAGVTHNLVKIWHNKYWFRGDIMRPKEKNAWKPIWAVTGATASFQLVVLTRIGAEPDNYTISVDAPVKCKIYREEYVKLGASAYPRFSSDYWPDILVEDNSCTASGIMPAVFLIELITPKEFKSKKFTCNVSVSGRKGNKLEFEIPVEVVRIDIQPTAFPLISAFVYDKSVLSDTQFRQMYDMLLENHLQPLTPAYMSALWDTAHPEKFEQFVISSMEKGQTVFQINQPDERLYEFISKKQWLSRFMIYSNSDEPSEETLKKANIPYAENMRAKFPGLKIFLASEFYQEIEKACDICLTDLSTSHYDPRTFVIPEKPLLWHYYCHLPINVQVRSPVTIAPNMMIDNTALQHRMALWMSWHYKAKGVYIWAGNCEWSALGKDFWRNPEIKEEYYKQNYRYPYGGVHYGNGFLVYPPRETGGEVLPSLRLKILRDGMEDIAVFNAIAEKYGDKLGNLLNPVPTVFSHPQYYDNLPETLLERKEKILKALHGIGR